MRILVAGAGIGGTALVAALRELDCDIDWVERAPAPRQSGVGIVLHPNGMRALGCLGLDSQVAAGGNILRHMTIMRGAAPLDISLPAVWDGMDQPTVAIVRPDLQALLTAAALTPGAARVRFRTGLGLLRASTGHGAAHACFSDDSQAEYDLVVGADGVHSALRQHLYPGQAAISTGFLYFRFVARRPAGMAADRWHVVERAGASYGCIPLAGQRMHCFVQLQTQENPCAQGQELAFFADTFCHWDPLLQTSLDERCSALHCGFAYMVRPVAWGEGRCLLLGDAAHAVSPSLSEGGSLAIEDAVVLAAALRGGASVDDALARYRLARSDRITWAYRMGLAQVNAVRLQRAPVQSSAQGATLHMRAMYAPLCAPLWDGGAAC